MENQVTVPTSIVIFGVTGDLARKKLFPALFDLFSKQLLPDKLRIVGFSRKAFSHAEFKTYLRKEVFDSDKNKNYVGNGLIDEFLATIRYVQGQFDEGVSYERLASFLYEIDLEMGVCSNKLLYLSVPPGLYPTILPRLSASGLTIPCKTPDSEVDGIRQKTGWTRLLVEKPFGSDAESARNLDAELGLLFKEDQIFRIDHYLAKETVQNIISFRFSNSIFEPLWNRKYIEKVEINVLEKNLVGSRGATYEGMGALKDVGQNHMLQMLALVAMEKPDSLSSDAIRSKRADILKNLEKIEPTSAETSVVRGQYEGYRNEPGVSPQSTTETFFVLKACVKNDRWDGVPFIMKSGKALRDSQVDVKVYFKNLDGSLKSDQIKEQRNILTFRIQPDEGISLLFWSKAPGFEAVLEPRSLSFNYSDQSSTVPEAYERVLYDCINGDQTLFTSTEEVSASWEYIMSVLNSWKTVPLLTYAQGSEGPIIN